MTPVHMHLLINHVPVLGTIAAILLLAWALARRRAELARAGLALFVVAALAGGVTYLTGEPAEEAVERLPGVEESYIEEHEEAGQLAAALLGALGAASLAALVAYRRAPAVPRGFAAALLALSLVPAGAMARTAYLGGQIRHSEIRPGAAAAPAPQAEAGGRH